MASYLRNWIPSLSSIASATPAPPDIVEFAPVDEEEDDAATIRGSDEESGDNDVPPAFPSLTSAQRAGKDTSTLTPSVPRVLTDTELMPPPPLPGLTARRPGVPYAPSMASSSLLVPPSATSSLAVPPSTTKLPKKASKKVALAPGHGPLDWANLKKSGADLRVSRMLLFLTALKLTL